MVLVFTVIMMVVTQTGILPDGSKAQLIIIPLLLFLIRLNTGSIQNYGYHLNQVLFPVMMRGQSSGVINFVSRPFASIANIIVEYT